MASSAWRTAASPMAWMWDLQAEFVDPSGGLGQRLALPVLLAG